MIKFLKHSVKNTETGDKCRVYYNLDNHISCKLCVWICAKDVLEKLKPIFGSEVINDTDSMTDYFESDRVILFEDHPLYKTARQHVEKLKR